jgi:hypothetical protein
LKSEKVLLLITEKAATSSARQELPMPPAIYPEAQQGASQILWKEICDGAIPASDPVTLMQDQGCKRASKALVSLWLYHRLYEVNPTNKNISPGDSLYPTDFLQNVGGFSVGKEVENFMNNRPQLFINQGLVFNRHNILSKLEKKSLNCTLVKKESECVKAIQKLEECKRVGFDCEMSTGSNKLLLIRCVQLCGRDSEGEYHPFIFWIDPRHPRELFDDGGLKNFLQNTMPKFTIGGSGDCALLQAVHGIIVGGVEECQAIGSAIVRDVFGPGVDKSCAPSLRLLAAVCGVRPSTVPKSLAVVAGGPTKIKRMFDKPLSEDLKQYAAFDGYACLRIYEELEKIHISSQSLDIMLKESVLKRRQRLSTEQKKRAAWMDGMP